LQEIEHALLAQELETIRPTPAQERNGLTDPVTRFVEDFKRVEEAVLEQARYVVPA